MNRFSTTGLCLTVLLAAAPTLAQQTVYFVPDVPTDLGPATFLSWQVIRYDPPLRTIEQTFPAGTPVNALYRTAGGDWLLTVATPARLGGTEFGTDDVIRFDGVIYSTEFDGAANGVPAGARIDSLYVDGDDVVVGFAAPVEVGGLELEPADLARFDGGVWSFEFDASAVNPSIPPTANVTGAGVEGTTLVVTFDVPTTLGPTTYPPGQLVAWDGAVFSFYQFDAEWPATSRLRGLFIESCVGVDTDGDTVPNECDNCPGDANVDQRDADGDGDGDACDTDDDDDTVPDELDCAPFSPGVADLPSVLGPDLLMDKDIGSVLTWLPGVQAPTTNVYRGEFAAGQGWSHDLTCFAAELPIRVAEDLAVPAPGTGFYYLITGRNACGESVAHFDSAGAPIVPTTACAAQNRDSDADAVLDVADSCPLWPNTAQDDADRDFVGDPCDNCTDFANADQRDSDLDSLGDVCDDCTDTDGDGFGDAAFSPTGCGIDNCADVFNPGQEDGDGDGAGDECDPCASDAANDSDSDGICGDVDNCPVDSNGNQSDDDADGVGDACDPCTDTDDDGFGDPGFSNPACDTDNCPGVANPGQADLDRDSTGDACDLCPVDPDNDGDVDGVCGNVDNCPTDFNPFQTDADGDGLGNACDPCLNNPDTDCIACPMTTDPDGDGVCREEILLVVEGSGMRWLANASNPGLALLWTSKNFNDANWNEGLYGVGYDGTGAADALITTTVPADARSIYTRAEFTVVDPQGVDWMLAGADYDDGWTVWLNGVEIYRSPQMPIGAPNWDTQPTGHEASNATVPNYEPLTDISATGVPALQPGRNVLAIGVWNSSPASSDLLVVPRISINGVADDNCPNVPNPDQADGDGDGIGDACDPS